MNKNIPFISLFLRSAWLWIFMLIGNWATLTQHHFSFLGAWEFDEMRGWEWHTKTPFEAFGAILYVWPFSTAVFIAAMLVIHLRYRNTIDADAAEGRDLIDWNQCSPYERVKIRNLVFASVFVGLCILCSSLARGEVPKVDEEARWKAAALNPKDSIRLDVAASLFNRTKARYQTIQAMRPNGVPAPILFCLHYRESDNNFHCHAHEGSSLLHRTKDEPKGRPLHPEPPYTFEQSAEDAYYVCERPPLDKIDWRNMQAALDKMESFNGFGYRRRGVAAPYLWSGTSIYHGGKYVRDGVFSATAMDAQLGCAAILKGMIQRGVKVAFVANEGSVGRDEGRTDGGIVGEAPRFDIGGPSLRIAQDDRFESGPRVVVFRSAETPRVVVPRCDEQPSVVMPRQRPTIVGPMAIIDEIGKGPVVILADGR